MERVAFSFCYAFSAIQGAGQGRRSRELDSSPGTCPLGCAPIRFPPLPSPMQLSLDLP